MYYTFFYRVAPGFKPRAFVPPFFYVEDAERARERYSLRKEVGPVVEVRAFEKGIPVVDTNGLEE